jgi:hypothetical protein
MFVVNLRLAKLEVKEYLIYFQQIIYAGDLPRSFILANVLGDVERQAQKYVWARR